MTTERPASFRSSSAYSSNLTSSTSLSILKTAKIRDFILALNSNSDLRITERLIDNFLSAEGVGEPLKAALTAKVQIESDSSLLSQIVKNCSAPFVQGVISKFLPGYFRFCTDTEFGELLQCAFRMNMFKVTDNKIKLQWLLEEFIRVGGNDAALRAAVIIKTHLNADACWDRNYLYLKKGEVARFSASDLKLLAQGFMNIPVVSTSLLGAHQSFIDRINIKLAKIKHKRLRLGDHKVRGTPRLMMSYPQVASSGPCPSPVPYESAYAIGKRVQLEGTPQPLSLLPDYLSPLRGVWPLPPRLAQNPAPFFSTQPAFLPFPAYPYPQPILLSQPWLLPTFAPAAPPQQVSDSKESKLASVVIPEPIRPNISSNTAQFFVRKMRPTGPSQLKPNQKAPSQPESSTPASSIFMP